MIHIALAFVFGAFCLQQQSVLPEFYWVFLPVFSVGTYSAIHHSRFFGACYVRLSLVILSSFMLGFFWAAIHADIRMSDALPSELQNKPITLIGVVASSVEHLERGERFRFDVEQVLLDNEQESLEKIRVPRHISLSYYPADSQGFHATAISSKPISISKVTKFKVGERWQLVAKLKRPHGTQNPHGYDFEAWALAENIRATGTIKTKAQHHKLHSFVWRPQYAIEYLRESVKQRIANVLQNRPYTGIVQALVMGDDASITADDWQLFLRTGTTHLMSISGLHITMLSGLAFLLSAFLWRRYPKLVRMLPARKAATLAGVIIALVYVLLAGFAVPAQRTLYMLLVFAVALWSGRQVPISRVLALALLAVVVLDPWAVLSAGFWLSFTAVAVLAYAFAGRVGQTHWLKAALYSQWAVTLGMLPLLLFMFHQASVISPVANAFAIPLISFLVTPLALMGSFLPMDVFLELAYFALEICMQTLTWLNHAPTVVWQQHAPPAWTMLLAAFGMAWLLLPSGFPLRSLGLLGLLPMFLLLPNRIAEGDMKVAILDVGQGLSVVIRTASHNLVYDTGSKSSAQSDAAKRVILPYLLGEGVEKLDMLMISHDDNDHTGGMNMLLANIPVLEMRSSMDPTRIEAYPQLDHQHCEAGQHWVWDGVYFDVLHPQKDAANMSDNNRSCVLRVRSRVGSLLLTGDIEKLAEQQILMRATAMSSEVAGEVSLKTDVIVAPHHGSKTSSSDAFVSATAPHLVVFSNGYLNRFRHPNAHVLSRYDAIGSKVVRSDYDGAILLEFISDQSNRLNQKPGYQMTRWRQYDQRYWHDLYE